MRAAIRLPRHLLAGFLLASLEILLVVATGRELFLSWSELGRYALLACTMLPALSAALGWLVESAVANLARGVAPGEPRYRRRLRWLTFIVSAPLCAWTLWSLTSGRQVRGVPGRALLVALTALAIAQVLAWVAAALTRLETSSPAARRVFFGMLVLAIIALTLDMHVLRRLYPAFHLALSAAAVSIALAAAAVGPWPASPQSRPWWHWWALSFGLFAAALLNVRLLSRAPNVRFAIVETAPLSGKLLRLARTQSRSLPVAQPHEPTSPSSKPGDQAGIDLRGGDLLLITIDALRADRLRAYGGHGLTPALDALAAESVVFLRAYTPTPHTSYALSSLMTGKFLQPLLALAETTDHPTLAALLRRHGYRTAAFYPPAIFFVDGERFEWLRRGQLGFEYVKVMFATAAERVPQLEQYLREVAKGHPLFVWVHLFEPHEPYEPPAQFVRGETPLARYDGEVAAADASVAKLVAAFRAARPLATVIVSADHGEEFGDHGGQHHGTTLFDEQVRVPLLWSSPGKTRPAVVRAPVDLIDLPTTLLSAFGIPRDVRMRGHDLGPLLMGAPARPDARAFALIDGARMVSDGQLKLICGDDECQLFDLAHDPAERRDLSQERVRETAELRSELGAFMASLPRVEALAMHGGGAWPEALVRARLGDASAASELVPLFAAVRADVRAAAARAAGELGASQALELLSAMRESDTEPEVRAEAAVASLRLGERRAHDAVAALLPAGPTTHPGDLARRAALALAGQGDATGAAVLIAVAKDSALDETQRLPAIRALATLGDARAGPGLIPLLAEVRLRAEVADALGRTGDRDAIAPLLHALNTERYPGSRRAEARALLALGARPQALALTRRFLGTESSLPDGVGILLEAGALAKPSGAGADLMRASEVRRGLWQCEARGCRPVGRASIMLPGRGAPLGPARIVLRVFSEAPSRLLRLVGDSRSPNPGVSELGFALAQPRGSKLEVEADEGVWLQALAVVQLQDDIPAPPPEPWSNTPAPP